MSGARSGTGCRLPQLEGLQTAGRWFSKMVSGPVLGCLWPGVSPAYSVLVPPRPGTCWKSAEGEAWTPQGRAPRCCPELLRVASDPMPSPIPNSLFKAWRGPYRGPRSVGLQDPWAFKKPKRGVPLKGAPHTRLYKLRLVVGLQWTSGIVAMTRKELFAC